MTRHKSHKISNHRHYRQNYQSYNRQLDEAEIFYELLGAIFRQAIIDYQRGRNVARVERQISAVKRKASRNRSQNHKSQLSYYIGVRHNYEDAKSWLFSPDGVEAWLAEVGLDGVINMAYIRKMADGAVIHAHLLDVDRIAEIKGEDEGRGLGNVDTEGKL